MQGGGLDHRLFGCARRQSGRAAPGDAGYTLRHFEAGSRADSILRFETVGARASDERLEIEHFLDVGQQHEFDASVLLAVGVRGIGGNGICVTVTSRM